MTQLSVNVNKIATLRNARGGDNPNVVKVAQDCERFGAQGITVHPRPDERHIRYQDVLDLSQVVTTEFNIEGYPNQRFIDLVLRVKPHQVTLVPDPPEVLTSNAGWDTFEHASLLTDVLKTFRDAGIRTSIFMEPDARVMEQAAKVGTERIELYTEAYASGYATNRAQAVQPYVTAAKAAVDAGLALNAGHDLDLANVRYFKQQIPNLLEVSIGHALVCDALYYGLENTVQMYRRELR